MEKAKRRKKTEIKTWCLQLGRPRIFATPNDLLTAFNSYLSSIQTQDENNQRKLTKIPTKLWFLFWRGISKNNWENYKKRQDFLGTVERIETFLEAQLEEYGLMNKANSSMVQFVLNTSYGRNPKQVIEEKSEFVLNEEALVDE